MQGAGEMVGEERESMCSACETKRGAEREGGGGGVCVCFSVVIMLIT